MQHSTQHCTSACLLLTEQAACRAASKHMTSHVSNNWPAREVCYFTTADSLKCNQLWRINLQKQLSDAYTAYTSMCSRYCQTLGYVDRQHAFVIYDAITYSKHRYENSNMAPAQNFEGYDFWSNANFARGVTVYHQKFLQTARLTFDPLLGHPSGLSTLPNLLNFWDYAQGLRGSQPAVIQKLVSHIIWQCWKFQHVSFRGCGDITGEWKSPKG